MQSDRDKDESYDDIVNCQEANYTSRLHRSSHKIKGKVMAAPKMDNFIEDIIAHKIEKK